MYTIGKFSNETGIPVRTLRFYDLKGVLKPGYIDQYTGYRYYTDDNLKDARNVLEMKSLGFTLDEIILYKENINSDVYENKINELTEIQKQIDEKICLLKQKRSDYLNQVKPKMRSLISNDKVA